MPLHSRFYTQRDIPLVGKLVVAAILLAGMTAAAQNGSAASPTAAAARPVSVLFSATDQNGGAIRNLSKEQIIVLDNNSGATVADLRPVSDAPLSVGIVLLASHGNFSKEQAAAMELVQKLIRSDQDRAFVITAGGSKHWTQANLEWQSDREALKKTISALDKNTGVPDAFNYELSTYSGDTATSVSRMSIEGQQGSGISVFDAVWGMMMADKRPARRVVVMFRDAWAHAPGLAKANRDYSDQKHMQIIAAAQRLHVAIFTIGIEEASPVSNEAGENIKANYGINMMGDASREYDRQVTLQKERLNSGGRANVERLANQTGGRAWWSNNKFGDAVAGIVNALNGQYLLTFVPAAAAPGSHELKINCGKIVRVAAPNAYLVASATPPPK
jgi:VWFA-related protein